MDIQDAADLPQRIGVVGAGQMGSGIAEVCTRAGLDVLVAESGPDALAAGRRRIEQSLAHGVRRGKLSEADREQVLAGIRLTTDLGDFADRDLVVEAVAETQRAKADVFAVLDKVVAREDAVLASNTSSIPIVRLGMATTRPEHVIGIHFFNPVPVLPLVELVPSLVTGERTRERAERFATAVLGKRVIRSTDRAGFVVNALLVPYLLSAIRMLESGFASATDIDQGMVLGCAHPIGPLALADLIGLDTTQAIAESLYAEFREPLYSPPPLLQRMVEAGHLGKKTGRGFHHYPAS
ncbi:3-hydroxybutyryl-CoA dehydrogenase [Streptomyces sp. NPDC001698]|uniref:3-hydroxybutyryl-CoA dehydrogenase n=1 Tax=unclassified Streptomyces TaxID=2593676 RepID=UPI0036AE3D08